MLSKRLSITILILSQVAVVAVWFSATAVLAEMQVEAGLSTARLAWLSTATQVGFGIGVAGCPERNADINCSNRPFTYSLLSGGPLSAG